MDCMVALEAGGDIFECRWDISHKSTRPAQFSNWFSVDITLQRVSSLTHVTSTANNELFLSGTSDCAIGADLNPSLLSPESRHSAARKFLSQFISGAVSASSGRGKAAKLIIPRTRGCIVRSDIIPLRIDDCPNVICAVSLAEPQQWYAGQEPNCFDLTILKDVFQAAAGAILLDTSELVEEATTDLDVVETEIRNRLSFPWILDEANPKKTLAFVGNYLRYPGHGGTGWNHYSTAKALNINLVVLDAPDCWLKDPRYSNLRAAFVPCDLSRNDGLCDRIITAISEYRGKIDGIVTFHESLQVGVARAANILSLPTSPPAALGIAADKYQTSIAAGQHGHLVSSAEDALNLVHRPALEFPLIIKPCRGWGSEGVYKADNNAEYTQAVEQAVSHAGLHGPLFVIEPYCDGPEVDVNMVLCRGELLFVEVSDDFPKRGDGASAGNSPSFLELDMAYPSKLPSYELNMLCASLHQQLLRLGLHSGVFHLEARVKNSRMSYVTRHGLSDLEFTEKRSSTEQPSSWLIEINARPPGNSASDPVQKNYGVDYIGLGLLFPLQDWGRIEALSRPFLQGAQYWCQTVFIPVQSSGIFDSGDICDELQRRRPDLAHNISYSVCYWQRGEMVPLSGSIPWIAHFVVHSRVGRRHLLELCETIRQEVRYSLL